MEAFSEYRASWASCLRPTDEIQYGQDILSKGPESAEYVPCTLLLVKNKESSAVFLAKDQKRKTFDKVFPVDETLVSCVAQNDQSYQYDFFVLKSSDTAGEEDYILISPLLSIKFTDPVLHDALQAADAPFRSGAECARSLQDYLWLDTYRFQAYGSSKTMKAGDAINKIYEGSTSQTKLMQNPFLKHDLAHQDDDLIDMKERRLQIRHDVLRAELLRREKDFNEEQTIHIKCTTWNMAGEELVESLRLLLDSESGQKVSCKVYGLAFQEIDTSSQAYLTVNDAKALHYQKRIEQALGEEFELVESHQLVGIFLCVYAHISIMPIVKQVEKSYVACGVLGMVGNKGGVGIRFNILDTTFVFLSCHLAAGQEASEKRNADLKTIIHGMFNDQGYWTSGMAGMDNVFLMGDLNYRITRSRQSVLDALSRKDLEGLLLHDQLSQQRKKGNILPHWSEGPIEFQPTYKFDIGTDLYDTSEKQRIPAWTDRILTKSARDDIELIEYSYKSVPEYYQSDHKPVVAVFKTKIRAILPNMQKIVETETQRMLDDFENELIPTIRLVSIGNPELSDSNVKDSVESEESLDFGSIRFALPVQRSFIIRNIGRIPASFSFSTGLAEDQTIKQFLWPYPARGELQPGEETGIQVTILVTQEEALILNQDPEQLPKFLILHTKDGPDQYITMSCTWSPD